MTYDRQHIKLTWGGELPGNETWACSLRTAPYPIVPGAVFINDGDLAGLSASYVPAVKAYHNSAQLFLAVGATLSWVKLAAIDYNGRYIPGQVSVKETTFAPITGSVAGFNPPNQIAACVSLTTDQPRGYAHAGRFYLPMPTPQAQADGLILESAADSMRLATKTFLEAIADVPGVDTDISPTPVVMSMHGSGSTHKITGCKIGRVLDTQRRRRRSLPENYKFVALDLGTF